MARTGELSETIDRVQSRASGDKVTVAEVTSALGDWGVLPLILLPALVAATPLSGIPGTSIVCGLLIATLSVELIFGFRQAVLPERLNRKSIDAQKLRSALSKIAPALRWIDRHTANRLTFLFHRPLIWIPMGLCLLSGIVMPFLEFIPFSSSIVATGVCFLVMAMMTRDGLFFLLALLPYAGVIYLLTGVLG